MIPNFWYAILESQRVTSGRPVGIHRLGLPLVLWRAASGCVVCMEDRCAHRGVALSLGRIVDGHIACRYHGLRYCQEGQCQLIPASGKGNRIPSGLRVKTYRVREQYGYVWLWWGEERDAPTSRFILRGLVNAYHCPHFSDSSSVGDPFWKL